MSERIKVAREFGCGTVAEYKMQKEIIRLRSREAKLLGVVGKLKASLILACRECSQDACKPEFWDSAQDALASVSAEMEIEGEKK